MKCWVSTNLTGINVHKLQKPAWLLYCAGCSGEVVLLSNNRTIAPFELVEVSGNISFLDTLGFTSVYNFGNDEFLDSWCTSNLDPKRQVLLGFTEPILITAMISGGRIESDSAPRSASYVTRFQMESIPPNNLSIWKSYAMEFSEPKVLVRHCLNCTERNHTFSFSQYQRLTLSFTLRGQYLLKDCV